MNSPSEAPSLLFPASRGDASHGALDRILWKLLAATAIALVPVAAVRAQSVEIDDDRTATVRTSDADNGAPADLTVTAEGSITVTDGPAVIVDSDNTLTNDGQIAADTSAGGIGVQVLTDGDILSGVINNGIIRARPESEDVEASGANFGIRLEGSGVFRGDIDNTESGLINVEGDGSIGIDLGAEVDGNILNSGEIDVDGDNGIGIAVRSTVSGNIETLGDIRLITGSSGTGIAVEAAVGGGVLNLGTVRTGTAATFDDRFRLVPEVEGGPALFINADVAGGVLNGPRVSGETEGSGAQLTSRGGGSALLLSSRGRDGAGRDVFVGAFGTGGDAFAIVNRGSIQSQSTLEALDVQGIRVEGAEIGGTIFETVLEGGINNQAGASIAATSSDGTATGISIGAFATVPEIRNAGTIAATAQIFSLDEDLDGTPERTGVGGDAIGILIEEGAQVDSIVNSGVIQVQAAGEASSATGILDLSGSVSLFDNSGTIAPAIQSNSSGIAVAADFRMAAQAMTFRNAGAIVGDVLLGNGDDQVMMPGGAFQGVFDVGGGVNTVQLSDGAAFNGAIRGQTIDLFVSASTFTTSPTESQFVRDAVFSDQSTLRLSIFSDEFTLGALSASGQVTLGAGTILDPNFLTFPADEQPIVLISADQLVLGDAIEDLNLQLELSSIIFEQQLELLTGPRDQLVVNLRRRTADEIGLDARRGLIFDSVTAVLGEDAPLGSAVANIDSVGDLESTLDQLTPEFSEIPRYVATNSQNIALGALSHRFSSVRTINQAPIPPVPESAQAALNRQIEAERAGWSFWLQELGYVADRDADDVVPGYDGDSIGFMAGADKPMLGADAIGLSIMQSIAEFDDDLGIADEFTILTSQVNLYGSYSFAGVFIDFLGNFAFHDLERERTIEIGSFSRRAEGDWTALQYGGSVRAGYRIPLGAVGITLSGSADYTKLEEDGYIEQTEGVALEVLDRDTTSLRAGGNFGIDGTFSWGEEVLIQPWLRGSYLTELDDDEVVTQARFVGPAESSDVFQLALPITHDDTIVGSAGVSFITRNVVITAGYDAEIADDFFSHMGALSIRLRF